MADKATLINKEGNKQVVDVGSTQAQDLFGQGYSLVGSTPTVAETKPVTTTTTTQPVAINGAEFNTKEAQQANFTDIKPIGNTLYGTPRSPVVPDVIPQTDFGNALSSEQSAQMESTANQKVGFNEKQIGELNKANERRVAGTASDIDIKNLTYAEGKGWSPTEAKQEEVIEPSTTDKIFNLMGNLTQERINAKEKAMKDQDLMAKGEAIAIAQTLANKLRTDLQNQGILDIKKEDAIRSKPILTSQIQGQLSEMSREQKLDTMIMQNNYNNALVELQIAEGNYDRAREIVKETADDTYNMSVDKLNAMLFKNEIEDMAAQKLEKSLLEEREMALNGYVHIKSPESLKGLTEDQIYRDPVNGNIYMKPEPKVEQIIEVGGRKIGLDKNGNKIRDYGSTLTPDQMIELEDAGWTFDNAGNPITPSQSDSGIFFTDANGDNWNIEGWATDQTKPQQMNAIAQKIGKVTDENIEEKVKEFTPGLTAEMIKEASAQTGVSWEAIMTMVVQEAQGGLSNVAKNNNNFGGLTFNNQEWIKEFGGEKGTARPSAEGGNYIKFPTKQDGLNAMAALMASYGKVDTTPKVVDNAVNQSAQNWANLIADGKTEITNVPANERTAVINELAKIPTKGDQLGDIVAKEKAQQALALKSSKGLSSAVGPVKLLRVEAPWNIAKKQNFIAGVEQLVSGLSLDSLIEAKSRGATFGALSDTEMRILASSATKIGSWKNIDKSGKVTGYSIDEKSFKQELDNINKILLRGVSSNTINQLENGIMTSTPIVSGVLSSGLGYEIIQE